MAVNSSGFDGKPAGSVVVKDVTCQITTSLLDMAGELSLPVAPLLEGVGHSEQFLRDGRNWISWESYCALCANLDKVTTADTWVRFGHEAPHKRAVTRSMRNIAYYFVDSQTICWALTKVLFPKTFPVMRSHYERLPDDRVRMVFEVDADRSPFPRCVHLLMKHSLQATPTVIDQPMGEVQDLSSPYRMEFLLRFPPSQKIITRLKRAWRLIFATRSALEEFSEQRNLLNAQFREAMQLQKKLIEQDTRLALSVQVANLSKMSALGEMAGGLAHEINNPLAIIQAQLDLLALQNRKGLLTGEAFEAANRVMAESIQRIARITRGLLEFSRDAGDAPREPMPVNRIVEGALLFCRERFYREKIELRVGALSEKIVLCRGMQISQALLNLLNNAVDAVATTQEKWIMIDTVEADGKVCLRITDSGLGIAEPVVQKLFQPFFSTKEVGKGTGLGLSTAKGLVEADGGELHYETLRGHTCFVVSLKV